MPIRHAPGELAQPLHRLPLYYLSRIGQTFDACIHSVKRWGQLLVWCARGWADKHEVPVGRGWGAARQKHAGGGCLEGCSCWGWQGKRTSMMRGPLFKGPWSPLAYSLSTTSPSQLSLHLQAQAFHAAWCYKVSFVLDLSSLLKPQNSAMQDHLPLNPHIFCNLVQATHTFLAGHPQSSKSP